MNPDTTTPCDLCNSTSSQHVYEISHTTPPFSVYRCISCGHLYMNPPFSEKELKKMYTEDYFTGKAAFSYTDERKNIQGFQAVANARVKKISRLLKTANTPLKKFLDIGCSFGSLLDAAADAGFDTYGLDISEYAVQEVIKKGHTAFQGTPEKDAIPGNELDVVTMIEVIEHLRSPSAALKKIAAAIKPGGIILIQTANMDGKQARKAGAGYHYFLPGHLHYFSKKTLSTLLSKNGFSQIRCHYPCEFGLIPKLKKSKGTFSHLRDYFSWLRIIRYHLKSKIHWGSFALTSGMVITAIKE